jgi:hypothetical protein
MAIQGCGNISKRISGQLRILKLNGRGRWLSNNNYYTTSSRVIVIVIEGSTLPFNLPFLVKILQCILIWRERLDREITLTAGDGPVS